MIVDLHAHYPMQLLPADGTELGRLGDLGPASVRDWIRALVLRIINDLGNFPRPGQPALTTDNLLASPVGVALSVLYSPFDEMDLTKLYGAPPDPVYFTNLIHQLDTVVNHVNKERAARGDVLRLVTTPGELAQAVADKKLALIHAVEGGFHLGDTVAAVGTNVEALVARGVAYITVAHLFWRQVATNSPAIPFLADNLYRVIFPEPLSGLTKLGEALIDAMVKHGILIDVTHMSEHSLDETLDYLDGIDAKGCVPVVATHSACRLKGDHEYNLTDKQIRRIAKRHGVIGLIACKHWMADGIAKPKTLEDSLELLRLHIDTIHNATGSHDFTAIGSDLDGFIKPTLPGLEFPMAFSKLQAFLNDHYTPEVAERICSENALNLLLNYWQRPL